MKYIAIIAGIMFVIGIVRYLHRGSINDAKASSREKYLKDNQVVVSQSYGFEDSKAIHSYSVVIDKANKNLYLSKGATYTRIPFSEVIGCEVRMDSEIVGGVGRAVAGGLLFGGVGAIVGAQTAKKHITDMSVAVIRENVERPQYVFKLIETETKTYSGDYTGAVEFSNTLSASIKAIMSITKKDEEKAKEEKQGPATTSANTADLTDRLTRLNSAKAAGLITEEEYETKRKEIISQF